MAASIVCAKIFVKNAIAWDCSLSPRNLWNAETISVIDEVQ
ncbi:hypothetical protein QIS74_10288 [Colletotrichum tabaci]|uniref:Uncharacterized protein n=1 Tax=Colletotrichum tabaci TaxID=1209068 RepID=A0AAV9T0V6_9PEZI